MRACVVFVVALCCSGIAGGAEIVLRQQAVLTSSIVRLGDIADVRATEEVEAADLAAVPLVPTPAPGTQQFLSSAQVRELLAAAGVDLLSLQLSGATVVAVNSPAVASPAAEVPANSAVSSPSGATAATLRQNRVVVGDKVAAAIVAYLHEQTGHDLWNVTVTPDNNLVSAHLHSDTQLAISGGQSPWTGRQQFDVFTAGQSVPVRAFASVERIETVAVTLRAIEPGDFIRATDISLQPISGSVSSHAIHSLESAVGKEALQAIRSGSVLMSTQLRAPRLVRRGERVSVKARAAGVSVRTYATAQQDGSLGDLIQVQAIDGKERYAARVSGMRELEVFAGGASAEEIAASGR